MAKRTPRQRAVIEEYKKNIYHKFNFGKPAKKEHTGVNCVMPPDFDGKFPTRLTRDQLKSEYYHEVYD